MSKAAVYLRVSTVDQEKGLESQREALKNYCKNYSLKVAKQHRYIDRLSGKNTDRPAFEQLQKKIFLGEVDTVIVWKLDRISRSLKDGVNTLCDWLDKGIKVVAVSQQLDFNGTTGKLVMPLLFALADLERTNIRENTVRGLQNARRKGKTLGRPKVLTPRKLKQIRKLKDSGMKVLDIAKETGIGESSVYAALKNGAAK